MPIISGQDAEVPSIKAMLRGDQYSTIFKDTRDLAKVTADMVDAALAGLDLGELVTIPSLPDVQEWENYDAARKALGPKLSRTHAASRYKTAAAKLSA